MQEEAKFLKDAGTFYLATVEGDQPRVRPFGAVCIFENKLYITTGNQKKVFKQMKTNPKVEICGMVKDTWLRIEAKVVLDGRREARQAMLDDNPVLNKMYKVDDGIFEVLYLKDATATYYSFTNAPRIVKF